LQTRISYRWIMLFLGWLIYFSFGLINTSVAPLIAPIMRDLGLTYTQMGAVTGAWQLIYIFSAQPLGLIIDRLRVYRSLLLGAIVISASSILRGFATGFESLFVFVALFGVGGPLVSIGTSKLISIWFKGRERGTASGINAAASAMGSTVALSVTNSIVLPLVGDWRNVFYLYGIFGLTIALIWLLLGRRNPSRNSKEVITESHEASSRNTMREVLTHRGIWLIVVIGIVYFLTIWGLQNWLPSVLVQKGFSTINAGYATSLMTLSGILGCIIVPRFIYRPNYRRWVIAFILLVSGAAILLLGVSESVFLWTGILSAGFFTRSLLPVLTVTLMDMPEVGAERMGTVGGLFFSVGEVGGFLGPFLMGYLKDATGSFLSGILFLTITTEVTIIAVAFLKLKEQTRRGPFRLGLGLKFRKKQQ
jgi:CP family cyanate transporter-like MFS transporter